MGRLLYCIAFTNDLESMKSFYRDHVGLRVGYEFPSWVEFENSPGAARFALLAVKSSTPRQIELCFEAANIEVEVAARKKRGLEFTDQVRGQVLGRIIHARDPEGNVLTLLEPKPREAQAAAAAPAAPVSPGKKAAAGAATAVAVATEAPVLATTIVNCRSMPTMRAFYRDRWGLAIRSDSAWWIDFDTGGTSVSLHPRMEMSDRAQHHAQNITLGFDTEDLTAWVDEARDRGLRFATSPIDEGFGMYAEVTDPDGNVILFRESPSSSSTVERLADAFEEDQGPHHEAIRKPVRKGLGVTRLLPRTSAGSSRTTLRKKKPGTVRKLASVRGGGPEGARRAPKKKSDPKRARNRPAVGRLKKAERKIFKVQKRAVARASKRKPVKQASSGRRRR